MTYQQAYEKVYTEYAVACRVYFQITRELSLSADCGTENSANYILAKKTLQTATDNYWNFLNSLKEIEFNPEDLVEN